MTRLGGSAKVALCLAALLASLSLVAWRQSRAFEILSSLDELRREVDLAEAEKAELTNRARALESRGRVVREAGERLEMHLPHADEIVYLEAESP